MREAVPEANSRQTVVLAESVLSPATLEGRRRVVG
jgi:hypothetical protein